MMTSPPPPQTTSSTCVEITPPPAIMPPCIPLDGQPPIRDKNVCGITLRWTVLCIALLEVILSSWCAGLFFYSAQNYEHVVKQFLQLPKCFTDSIAIALLNSLSFMASLESILGAWLWGAVKKTKLRHIHCWLVILLTYEIVLTIFLVFLGLAGCTTDRLNSFTFFRVFFRFLEFMVIFTFLEGETMKMMRQKIRAVRNFLTRRRQSHDASNATSTSNLSNCGGEKNCDLQQNEDTKTETLQRDPANPAPA